MTYSYTWILTTDSYTWILTTDFLYWHITQLVRYSTWLGWPLWNICVTNDYGYVSFVV